MNRLALFGARSALSLPLVLALGAWLGVLLAFVEWTPQHLAVAAGPSDSGPGPGLALLERGLRREGVWAAWLALFAPLMVTRAAWIGHRTRGPYASWLGAATTSPARATSALLCGVLVAASVVLGAATLTIELATSGTEPSARMLRFLGHLEHPARMLEANHGAARAAARIELAPPQGLRKIPSDAHLRAPLRALGPTTGEVELTLTRGSETTSLTRRLDYHETVELPLPVGPGALALSLRWRDATGAYLLGANELELFGSAAPESRASREVALRVLLALSAWLAAAFGLAMWMRPAYAALSVGALQLAIWLADSAPSTLPGGGLVAALGWIGRGRLPEPLPPLTALVALLVIAAGMALAVAGLRAGRSVA